MSVGTDTGGSIRQPAAFCGVVGLKPTYGRVSRYGAMALSWSMDKLGPICRSVDDCALVLEAINGADGLDPAAVDSGFGWETIPDVEKLRVGYLHSLFEQDPEEEEQESHLNDLAALDVLRRIGVELLPIELPDLPVSPLSFILSAEAAAAFDGPVEWAAPGLEVSL